MNITRQGVKNILHLILSTVKKLPAQDNEDGLKEELITRRSFQLREQRWSKQYLSLTIFNKWKIPTTVTISVSERCIDGHLLLQVMHHINADYRWVAGFLFIHEPAVPFCAQCALSY